MNIQQTNESFDLAIAMSKDDFCLLTQKQIVKDFANFHLDFPDKFVRIPVALATIENWVSTRVVEQLEKGERATLQLLYTVDIPEKSFLKLIGKPDFLPKLVRLIVHREAYKIWLRKKYSN